MRFQMRICANDTRQKFSIHIINRFDDIRVDSLKLIKTKKYFNSTAENHKVSPVWMVDCENTTGRSSALSIKNKKHGWKRARAFLFVQFGGSRLLQI